MVSLTEKLQAEEVVGAAISAQKFDPLPWDITHVSAHQVIMKIEDRLSSRSGESVVVDEDGPQVMDSGDSYFPSDNYPYCMAPVDMLQSEEDNKSGDGRNYFPDDQHHGEEEPLNWWVWS